MDFNYLRPLHTDTLFGIFDSNEQEDTRWWGDQQKYGVKLNRRIVRNYGITVSALICLN